MLIASWNVNSINARLQNVENWLERISPDVVLLQELKCADESFPAETFEKAGYHTAVHGQKTWNGVAILSKHPITNVKKGLPGADSDEQSRYIEAVINNVKISSIYLPNGNPVETEKFNYKIKWFDRLIDHARTLLAEECPVVLGGDFNIIPEARDCHDPVLWKDDALFRLESRRRFRTLSYLGYTDAFRIFNNESHQYTFWDYQAGAWQKDNGIRIDHFLLSPQAADLAKSCKIDKSPRGLDKASDHTPILLDMGDIVL